MGKEINLNPPLVLGQLPDTADELLKLDQVFMKSELKVGVIYVKEGQTTEEEILDNNDNSLAFEEFLGLLGETKRLCGNKFFSVWNRRYMQCIIITTFCVSFTDRF